jgi:hypothetical protein
MKNLVCFLFSVGFFLLLDPNTLFAQSINPNGGFEDATLGEKQGTDVTGWSLYADGGSVATFEINDDEIEEGLQSLRVDVGSLGSNAWDIQVVNEPFTVVPGAEYTYSVWAMADVEGPIVNFTVGSPSYAEWGRQGQVAMTTSWQQVTFQFTAPADATTGRAPIHLGETANAQYLPFAVYLDDLQIVAVTTGVESVGATPLKFDLGQNYPNPFNPTTTIEFSLPARSDVHLVLANVLGQAVREIATGEYAAGTHRVTLNASGLASGVYFYKLQASSFLDVKKLILMK